MWFIFLVSILFFIGCGAGNSETPADMMETVDLNSTATETKELNSTEIEPQIELNSTSSETELEIEIPESNSTEIEVVELNDTEVISESYTDEELTLNADSTYVTYNRSDFSAKILMLSFKGGLPVEDGVAMVKENENFSFELTWQNPSYAKNVNYYFFNGSQYSIHYSSMPIESPTDSYTATCEALSGYRYNCGDFTVDDSEYYEGETLPTRSSFVMAVCDRSTTDPERICDFIRIPIEFRE
ncbi:MAG: hypothetical protein K0U38_00070 [Epsilonproteobacteria bacterium]|nr:hypothetical protein [Campylobacterota bacterium]